MLYHPVTTMHEYERKNTEILLEVCNKLNQQVVWFWPNVDTGSDFISETIRIFRERNKDTLMSFVKNLSPENFLKLINNTECFLGNSSAALREGSYLGIPAVSIGDRQIGREHSNNVIFSNINRKELLTKIKNQKINKKKIKQSKIFGDGNAAKKITKVLQNITVNIQKRLTY